MLFYEWNTSINDSFRFFGVFFLGIISWKGDLLFNGRGFVFSWGRGGGFICKWGERLMGDISFDGGGRHSEKWVWGGAPPSPMPPHYGKPCLKKTLKFVKEGQDNLYETLHIIPNSYPTLRHHIYQLIQRHFSQIQKSFKKLCGLLFWRGLTCLKFGEPLEGESWLITTKSLGKSQSLIESFGGWKFLQICKTNY